MRLIDSRFTINTLKTVGVCCALLIPVLCLRSAAKEILSIVFGGCVFAFLLSPLCRLLEKRLPKSIAALFVLVGTCIFSAALLVFLLPLTVHQLRSISALLPDALERLHSFADSIADQLHHRLPELTLPEFNLSGADGRMSEIAKGVVSAVSSAADKVYRVFLMATLSYFLMADRERVLLRLELLVPVRWRRLAVRAGNILLREMQIYLRGQATIALAVGILAASALTVIGVPAAPLLGLLVGAFNVIPYLGPFLGGIPAVVMALSMSWQRAAFTVLALFLVQQIDGMVISPRIMGNITGFSPAVVLLAIFVGARIGGVGGMLFALPCLMAIRTVYRVFVQRHENN